MDTLNGFPVVARARLPDRPGVKPASVVIVDRGAEERERFVAALHCDGDPHWINAGYYETWDDAFADFAERARRAPRPV